MRFDGDPFTCQCEEEDKKTYGFQISHFYWSFSSDVVAVTVLIMRGKVTIRHSVQKPQFLKRKASRSEYSN